VSHRALNCIILRETTELYCTFRNIVDTVSVVQTAGLLDMHACLA